MEEDDGLLLNFAPSDGLEAKKQKLYSKPTGGRWKDRRKLQLSLQGRGRRQKSVKPDVSQVSGANSITVDEGRLKRMRDSESGNSSGASGERGDIEKPKRIRHSEGRGEHGGKNNSYVSSLFTSNEKSKTLVEDPKEQEQPEPTYAPSNAPLKDATSFEGLGLNEKLRAHLSDHLRFLAPTKVQRSTIPSLLYAKSDLFIKAQTGSGKTLAFLLPIVHKLMQEKKYEINRHSGTFAMVIAPTRELANQIYSVLETLSRCHHNIVPGIVIGGEKKKSEKARIRKGVNILVGTPGRLADHIENTSALDLSQLRWLILDEGDRLIELGFEETITKITTAITESSRIHDTVNKWQGLPTKRVNVLCSATMQENVQKLGNMLLDNPEMITVDSAKHLEGTVSFDDDEDNAKDVSLTPRENMTAPDQLVQKVLVVPPKLRLVTLNALFKSLTKNYTDLKRSMVFFSCSDSVNYHFDIFTRDGKLLTKKKNDETNKTELQEISPTQEQTESEEFNPSVLTAPMISEDTVIFKLHGSMTQHDRTSTLNGFIKTHFTTKKHAILFCTDVASRGLDLPDISDVIEYDPPFTIEDHLHRIGRSARVGKEGNAYMFLLPGIEEGYIDDKLSQVHSKGSLRVEGYDKILKAGYKDENDGDRTKTKWDVHATTWHLNIERWLLEDKAVHDKAALAFTSHVRAYATHLASERQYFNVKQLHLGHLAKAFGLRENPKQIGRSFEFSLSKKDKKLDPKQKMLQMARMAVKNTTSEFNY